VLSAEEMFRNLFSSRRITKVGIPRGKLAEGQRERDLGS
jgi:hypothetical protein